jgi:hypothetical protein
MSDAFAAIWRIAQDDITKLHKDLPKATTDMPNTVAFVVRSRQVIDSFNELPKDKRPPESIWFDGDKLEEWFDSVFSHDTNNLSLDIGEIEG